MQADSVIPIWQAGARNRGFLLAERGIGSALSHRIHTHGPLAGTRHDNQLNYYILCLV